MKKIILTIVTPLILIVLSMAPITLIICTVPQEVLTEQPPILQIIAIAVILIGSIAWIFTVFGWYLGKFSHSKIGRGLTIA